MDIEGEPRAKVISISDGVVKRVITSKRGRRIGIVIEDSYGNRYSYYGIRRMIERLRGAWEEGGDHEVRPPPPQGAGARRHAARVGSGERSRCCASASARPARTRRSSIPSRCLTAGACSSRRPSTGPPARASFIPRTRTGASPSARRSCCRSRCSPGACWPTPASRSIRAGAPTSSSGRIDRRVLAVLAFLAESGMNPTVTSLQCGRIGSITTSGNVSNHSMGGAVDIAAINGVPILGHQEPGGVTDQAVRAILTAAGRDGARRADLAARPGRSQLRDGRPRRPHPRRLPAG